MAAGVARPRCSRCTWPASDVTPWQLAPALAVTGLGMGLLMAPFFDIVLAGVEPHETGSASGTLTAVQQLGGALGVAVLGTLFFDQLGLGVNPDVIGATRIVLWIVAGMLLATFLAAFLLPKHAVEENAGH